MRLAITVATMSWKSVGNHWIRISNASTFTPPGAHSQVDGASGIRCDPDAVTRARVIPQAGRRGSSWIVRSVQVPTEGSDGR